MAAATLTGAEFKKQLRSGSPKFGLFVNSHSPTVAEQLAHSGYDWLLIDTQHGPMGYEKLSAMLSGVSNGGAKSMVRVGGTLIAQAYSNRWTLAPMACSFPISTPPKRLARPSAAHAIQLLARAPCISRNAA